ncbi:membrane lipoprotein TmpC precursor [Janthinobacterium sp. HH103]|uniref:BMP family ABC transporter substrate-binding protein n=1 Tax=Janthinobacterium agaricidamnosum TaxID=55508 RepID=A0A3G2E555_9BURK|nr:MULTISPECIES: BMP family ABC transporter substrate-binding protein [Janthinobacterium]AYM74870.1 BMP family ABC transporter substrate-binding protein [Janthinobacterium agaricidamnosum]MCC7684539.1 BMP family ABC transporter substrate-binding protein [Janthinobacterium sp. FW305-128]OEZ66912.1 membrane lipoprotein TmpC precursor [Janthinobacterium sp. HH100]OEZ83546.1 membrane lipoprotein TmpC precursor [Janthinobacterium sp. HH103]OEZ84575.1 membrane lipoprotein TmpC precursor [Janthinobac
MKLTQFSLTIAAVFLTAQASAATPKLGVVYDAGGKFDKSFNQSAFEGASRFKKDTGISFIEVQASSDTQAEQVMRGLARKKLDMIAAIGFAQTQAVQKVAKEFPNVKFVLIDGQAAGSNVNSVVFKEEEGSYLVGVAAAMASKSKKVGFIGGIDIPLIRNFACGYAQGVKAVNPKTEITQNMVGTTSGAWNDPAKGGELARSQFERGVDVVFAVAGGSGMGTLQMAKEKGKLAIGVDSNQNHLYPGSILTSMVKRVDNTVYDSFMQVKNGTWKGGVSYKGLKEGGVDWALDENNRKLITPEIEKRVLGARKDIIDGKIKVIDYRVGSSCPV